MRRSNVDISKLPDFTSYQEAVEYFTRFGKLTYFGVKMSSPPYYVYSYRRNNGVDYYVDIYQNGTVVVIDRWKYINEN